MYPNSSICTSWFLECKLSCSFICTYLHYIRCPSAHDKTEQLFLAFFFNFLCSFWGYYLESAIVSGQSCTMLAWRVGVSFISSGSHWNQLLNSIFPSHIVYHTYTHGRHSDGWVRQTSETAKKQKLHPRNQYAFGHVMCGFVCWNLTLIRPGPFPDKNWIQLRQRLTALRHPIPTYFLAFNVYTLWGKSFSCLLEPVYTAGVYSLA